MPVVERNSGFLRAFLKERDTEHARTVFWGVVILLLLLGVLSVAYRASALSTRLSTKAESSRSGPGIIIQRKARFRISGFCWKPKAGRS
jgi:hypothetical protein